MSRTIRRVNNRNWRILCAQGRTSEYDVFAKGAESMPNPSGWERAWHRKDSRKRRYAAKADIDRQVED